MSVPLRVVAFHEAGHSVVGEVCGIGTQTLTIVPSEDDDYLK